MILEILIVCAATDESIKTKGLSWESPQVLWLLALLLTSIVYFYHLPNPNPNFSKDEHEIGTAFSCQGKTLSPKFREVNPNL